MTTLDATTERVRTLYEQFPYPSGPPMVRVGYDARLLLSYGERSRGQAGPLRVLDAGCGRGVGLIACATLQPDVEFTGIDINRVGLADAQRELNARALANVRLQEVDLMGLEGLEVPPGGFDAIYSSGVVHHLSDPVQGLRMLARVLAPHGILSLMVYGCRAKFERVARVVELCSPAQAPLAEKLRCGRDLVQSIAAGSEDPLWAEAAGVSDVEFVDRYMHVQEVGYSVDALRELTAAAGLEFCRWSCRADWDLDEHLDDEAQVRALQALGPRDQERLIEQLAKPTGLEVCLMHPGNRAREAPRPEELEARQYAVHPEIEISIVTRATWGATRTEKVSVRRDGRETVLQAGSLVQAVRLLQTQNLPFDGTSMVAALGEAGVTRAEARGLLAELFEREWVYSPHPVDVAAGS